jgi:serine/threonine-protein kinase
LERDEQITILFEAYSLTLKIADKIKLRKLLQYHGIVYYRDMYDMWLVQQGVAFTLQYLRWKKTLGKGSFGQVHLLQNYLNEHLCAMKVIKVQPDDSDSLVNLEDDKYLLGEIETLQRITSPYVAAMIPNNALVCGSIAFFIMEFYSGGSLRDKLDRIHPASLWQHSPEQTATVMRQLLEGIATIHDARAWHRDLKPENILFDNQDTLKISDFGLAKAYKSKVTHGGGTIVGTAGYMAPEISQGMLSTPACDIWYVKCQRVHHIALTCVQVCWGDFV